MTPSPIDPSPTAASVRAETDDAAPAAGSPVAGPGTASGLPDRLSVDPASPHYAASALERPIGIRLNGKERSDVEEYCVSEGWVKVPAGRALDRKGQPMMIKLKGKVEAYYR